MRVLRSRTIELERDFAFGCGFISTHRRRYQRLSDVAGVKNKEGALRSRVVAPYVNGRTADHLHLVVGSRFAVRRMTPLGDQATVAIRAPSGSFGGPSRARCVSLDRGGARGPPLG